MEHSHKLESSGSGSGSGSGVCSGVGYDASKDAVRPKRFVGLSNDDRNEIFLLRRKGHSMREIAKALGRSPNTVS